MYRGGSVQRAVDRGGHGTDRKRHARHTGSQPVSRCHSCTRLPVTRSMVPAESLDVGLMMPLFRIAQGCGALSDTGGRPLVSAIMLQRTRHQGFAKYDTTGANRTTGSVFTDVKDLGGDAGRGRRRLDMMSERVGDGWKWRKWRFRAMPQQEPPRILEPRETNRGRRARMITGRLLRVGGGGTKACMGAVAGVVGRWRGGAEMAGVAMNR
jgi:hypothetical protein